MSGCYYKMWFDLDSTLFTIFDVSCRWFIDQTPTWQAQTLTPANQTLTLQVLRPVQAWAFLNYLENVQQSNARQFHDCQWPYTHLYTMSEQENIVLRFFQFLLVKYISSYGEDSNPLPLWFIAAPYWHPKCKYCQG